MGWCQATFRMKVMSLLSTIERLKQIYFSSFWDSDMISSGRTVCKTVKQPHYRPGQALRVPGGWGSKISRQWAHECGKVVSPTHRPPLLPRKYSWYSFLLEAESIPRATVRPEGLCQWKIPVIPSGIEPATFRLVAQCLNQLRHRVPPTIKQLPLKDKWSVFWTKFRDPNDQQHANNDGEVYAFCTVHFKINVDVTKCSNVTRTMIMSVSKLIFHSLENLSPV